MRLRPDHSLTNVAAVTRLAAFAPLSESERLSLGAMPVFANYRSGADLSTSEDEVRPQFIMSGWACYYESLGDGRRQFLSFLLPGDSIGLSRKCRWAWSPARALTAVVTADAMHLREGSEGIAAALAVAESDEHERLVAHIIRLGRQTAYERAAHLLLELYYRLAAVGLADNGSMPMPLTQEVFADGLGLSIVHVNRTLQQLRRDRLLQLEHGRALLGDLPRMRALCDLSLSIVRN